MKAINLNRDWTLQEGEPSNIPMMPAKTRTVQLPHDFMIEKDVTPTAKNGVLGGCYEGGLVSYTKYLELPEDLSDKRILVRFDGCMGMTKVVVNGHVAGRHHYGYTPFTVDLTPFLYPGEKNRLTVTVGTDYQPNSRWYAGGGLYRHAQLLFAPKVHLAVDAIYAHVDHLVNGDAFVTVEVTVENHTDKDAHRWVCLTARHEDGTAPEATGKIRVFVPAGESAVCRTLLCFENAAIWDIDHPELYTITAELTDEEAVTDTAQTLFGVREITVDAKNGFRLNGSSLKLKGGCIHADNGILGAASYYDSEYRKVKLHKENGFNALRFAHNPVSSEMLEACDRLGMLVIDEAFDTWNMQKNYYDFSQFFAEEGMRELEAFLRRDRNHPCVAIWSIGNELVEEGGLSDGYKTSAALAAKVRELDATRPVAGALCSLFTGLDDKDNGKFWQSLMSSAMTNQGAVNNLDSKYGRAVWADYTEAFAAPWDIVGYNYLSYHYEETREKFPNRILLATESKPKEAEEYWGCVEKYPFLLGDFEWTSHDYIGEAGIGKVLHVPKEEAANASQAMNYSQYPWRLASTGDFDLCGFEKPQLAFKRILWGSKETYLAVKDSAYHKMVELVGRYGWPACAHSWTWPAKEGSPTEVDIYSAGGEVELILNGRSLGRQLVSHHVAVFSIPYESGTLEAISYVKGKEISRDTLASAGKAVGLKLTPEQPFLSADGESLCFVRIEAVDEAGAPVPYLEVKAAAKAKGAAALIAFGTGRGCTEENYTTGEITLYQGKALAILRAGLEEGLVTLTVEAEGLSTASLELEVKQCCRERLY